MTHSSPRLLAALFTLALLAAGCSGSDEAAPAISLGEDTGGAGDGAVAEEALPTPTGADDVFVTDFRDFNGGQTSLQDLAAGQPVVLNFFASWCAPCVSEMPDFEEVHQQRADEIQFVGLATRNAPSEALGLVERTGVTYPLGLDPDGSFFAVFGGLGMPTTVFLDSSGQPTDVHTGQLTVDALNAKIDEHLS